MFHDVLCYKSSLSCVEDRRLDWELYSRPQDLTASPTRCLQGGTGPRASSPCFVGVTFFVRTIHIHANNVFVIVKYSAFCSQSAQINRWSFNMSSYMHNVSKVNELSIDQTYPTSFCHKGAVSESLCPGLHSVVCLF